MTKLLHKFIIVSFLTLISSFANSQVVNMPTTGNTTYPGGVPLGATINFYDNGGSGGNYANNCNATYTFCPKTAGQIICITFTSHNTEQGYDYVDIYSGSTATGSALNSSNRDGTTLTGLTFLSTSADGCITIKFTSDGVNGLAGWAATVKANAPCPAVTAGQIGINANICHTSALNPGNPSISFDGSLSSATSPQIIDQWYWDWGDGTSSTLNSASTTHSFPAAPGVYVVNLQANDNSAPTCLIPSIGCVSTNQSSRIVYVVPPPLVVNESANSQQICKGASALLNAQIRSVSVQNKRDKPNPPVLFLPDGSGVSYSSPATLKSFPFNSKVTASCLPTITVCIEHDYINDLSMQIVAPDGKTVYLMNRDANNASANVGLCSPSSSVQGKCGCYVFVNSAAQTLAEAPTNGTIPIDDACKGGGTLGSNNGAVIPPGTFQACDNSAGTHNANPLGGLIGAPLNGTWTLKVTDNQAVNDGYVCTWDISFPGPCYGLQDITPNVVGDWVPNAANPGTVTLNAGKTSVLYIPTGSTSTVNDGGNNTTNPGLPLTIDPNGNQVTDNQTSTFTVPGYYEFDFNYSDDTAPCNYKLTTKKIKVYDVPNVSALSCSSTGGGTQLDVQNIPAIINNNHTGADIGVWEYSINNSTWQAGTTFPGTTGSTYTIYVRNKAFPTCTANASCTVAVPIELLNFTGVTDKGVALLHWETATETNNDHFEIERSKDGSNYVLAGIVKGYQNSLLLKKYDFTDLKLEKGLSYYRLKQVDNDGKFSYSNIITLDNKFNYGKTGIVSIHPNPLPKGYNSLDIDFSSEKKADGQIIIKNSLGQEIYRKTIQLVEGSNTINIQPENVDLGAGIYYIQVQTPTITETKRLVVN